MSIKTRVKNILLTPSKEWEIIKKEEKSISDMFFNYVGILALIPALGLFIGRSIVGIYGLDSVFRLPFFKGLFMALMLYVGFIVGVFILGLVIDNIAPYFGAKKDSNSSFKVAIYASTASWVGGIFHLIPAFSIVANIASIYSLYLLFVGLKTIKDAPSEKIPGYFIATIIAAIVIYVIVGFIASSMALGAYAFNSLIGV